METNNKYLFVLGTNQTWRSHVRSSMETQTLRAGRDH
jgi:hypothetical protein